MDGQEKHLRQLIEVTAKRQGPMAQLTVTLANACLDKDPAQALTAAMLAQELDLAAVESRCAVTALDFARLAGQARLAREAETRIDRLRRTVPVMPLLPQTEGERLTQRERQVAKLAGRGLGNRAIAELMGVSVRTVEGHLYQVFSKLGISSRGELT
jgi:DNA-binding NarL/FixJ family response regulator